jgi:hypothetical protein
MTTGFLGIAYSSDKIGENGRFVDKTLEGDFLRARYDLLRQPNKCNFNESAWRKGTSEARKEFLKMLEDVDKRNVIDPTKVDPTKVDHDEDGGESDVFTYAGEDHPPKGVKTIIIQSDVQLIENAAFKDLPDLKCVVFPDEGQDFKIEKNAIENCPSLTSVRLNGVTYIGDEAFLNCTGLVAAELGSSIQHIGMGAFKNCSSLTTTTIPPNVTFIGDYAFANCSELKTATVMDGVVEVPAYCFQNDAKLEQVVLPSSIEKVGEGAFENCQNCVVYVPTMEMDEAEELLGVKMEQRAEEDPTLFKCDKGFMVKLYKDLY